MHILTSRKITIPVSLVALLAAVVFGLNFKTKSQQLSSSTAKQTQERLQQIEQSADQPLRVVENGDSPLRIVDARVKEISGPDFVKLTGQQTDLPTVCSVPDVKLLNSSTKTITGFVLVVRDPNSKTSRGIVQSKLEIAQGQTYLYPRNSFVKYEWSTTADNEGKVKTRFAPPAMNSEDYWLSFATRSNLFVTVAQVNFHDGSSWTVKEGGDIR
jgi:hypothetical protein